MKNFPVLIVDDEPEILGSLGLLFESWGFDVKKALTGAGALKEFSETSIPIVICDNSLPDTNGIELLKKFRETLPEVQMIIVTGRGTIDIAVSAMKAGVFDFVTKPVNPEYIHQLTLKAKELYDSLTENKALRKRISILSSDELVGSHPSIKKMLELIHTVAPTESTVLIEGESGTGKELVARLIHKKSNRANAPFIAVDCGAITQSLIESELFGHEKGAFTGAVAHHTGRFERANKGTLFLDEITNLPFDSQAKLLRALQEKVIERIGGQKPIAVDIRLVAATNTDLKEAVDEGNFRDDLYYRINVLRIKIPSLRERLSDIPELAMKFIKKHKQGAENPAKGISKEALKTMMEYSWPGNVRELENVIEHAVIMAKGDYIMPEDLPPLNASIQHSKLDEAEKTLIIKAIKDAGGNKYKAAKILGIPRSSLYSKLKKFSIS